MRAGEALTPPPPFGDRDDAWMLQGVRESGALRVCAHGLLAGGRTGAGLKGSRAGSWTGNREQISAGGLIGQLVRLERRGGSGGGRINNNRNNNRYSCTADDSRREVEGQTGLVHARTNRYQNTPAVHAQLPPCVQK